MYTAKLRYHAIAKHKFCINKTGGGVEYYKAEVILHNLCKTSKQCNITVSASHCGHKNENKMRKSFTILFGITCIYTHVHYRSSYSS